FVALPVRAPPLDTFPIIRDTPSLLVVDPSDCATHRRRSVHQASMFGAKRGERHRKRLGLALVWYRQPTSTRATCLPKLRNLVGRPTQRRTLVRLHYGRQQRCTSFCCGRGRSQHGEAERPFATLVLARRSRR